MSVDISIIVPVFNTASYLKQCLNSLCAQPIEHLEFILVDDGSTDGSVDILREYAHCDNRFKLLTRENRGAASARNLGLSAASGKFIGFVDSDDWIEADMFSKLWEAHLADPDADIVQCSYINEYGKETLSMPVSNKPVMKMLASSGGKLKGAEALLLDDGALWNRIFRRTMIEKNAIRFKEEMLFGEDVFFCFAALTAAAKIVALPQCLYHYRRNRPGSHVASSDRRIFSYFKTIQRIVELADQQGRTELIPWINHLKLSYLSWGFERLAPEFQQEYFAQYRQFLLTTGTNKNSPVKFPPFSGCFMYDLRYMVLRILHPLTLKAIINGNFKRFKHITALRRFLAALPFKLKR